jgi:hypothetical protein
MDERVRPRSELEDDLAIRLADAVRRALDARGAVPLKT